MKRTTIVASSILGAVVVLLLILAITRIGREPVTEDEGELVVEIAWLSVPIADEEPVITGPDQYLGVPGPEPGFDTTDLGPDLSFELEPDLLEPLDSDEVLRAVYLGHDTKGDPYYIWHSGSENFWQLLGQIIADFGSFGRVETSYGSEMVGANGDDPLGLTAGSIQSSGDSPPILTAEWHGLPEAVAVVVFLRGEDPLGWQRPVSGTAAIQYAFEAGADPTAVDIDMLAVDVEGEEWNRVVLFQR